MFLSQMDGFMMFVQDFKEIVGIVGCFFFFFEEGGGGGGGGGGEWECVFLGAFEGDI